jgi:hypothetical protein
MDIYNADARVKAGREIIDYPVSTVISRVFDGSHKRYQCSWD